MRIGFPPRTSFGYYNMSQSLGPELTTKTFILPVRTSAVFTMRINDGL